MSDKNVTWSYEGLPLPSNVKPIMIGRTQKQYLSISVVNHKNAGYYICHGEDDSNFYFEDSATLTLSGKFGSNYFHGKMLQLAYPSF